MSATKPLFEIRIVVVVVVVLLVVIVIDRFPEANHAAGIVSDIDIPAYSKCFHGNLKKQRSKTMFVHRTNSEGPRPALETVGQGQRGLNSPNTCPTDQAQKSHRWGRRRPNTYGRGPAVAYTNPQYLIHVAMLIIRKDNNQL